MFSLSIAAALALTPAAIESDKKIVADLDTAYQAAVERNDADAMAEILHEDMILVAGRGDVYAGADLIKAARDHVIDYEAQVEDEGTQTVRMYAPDTAIVTARLYIRGTTKSGDKIDKRLWFSDTYVRTEKGWRYAFGQASIALPDAGE